MKIKTITGSLLSASLMVTSFPVILPAVASGNNNEMRDISTMEIVQDMGIGINLGNTFESSGDWIAQWGDGTPNSYETAWGSPTVTKELIQGYADAGFGVVRVPVAWSNMMANDGSYKINPDYMSRVQQVVDWILDEDMYVILNLHWDGGWLEKLPEDHDNVMAKYSAIWEQVSAEFSMYGDHLMFEAQNEELGWGTLWNQWSGSTDGKAESYGYVNEVNQTFVNIVRNSGGNNPERHLLISGYNTDIKLTCDPLFKMPDDPAGRMALSVHYYTPAGFAILEEDADWGKASSTWGTEAEIAELERNMDSLKNTFTEKGIPVI
ncbi:MAG: glycoside hydrolase family 5 protein, partial [Ruminococcus sp.]|nr:glycoside hydrolase family 5 protein [Ruminococcus sp.]